MDGGADGAKSPATGGLHSERWGACTPPAAGVRSAACVRCVAGRELDAQAVTGGDSRNGRCVGQGSHLPPDGGSLLSGQRVGEPRHAAVLLGVELG